MRMWKKVVLILLVAILAMGTGFAAGICWYSTNTPTFYEGTTINGIDVGQLQDWEAVQALNDAAGSRTLRVVFADHEEEVFTGSDLGICVQDSGRIAMLLKEQRQRGVSELTAEELQLTVEELYTCRESSVLNAITGLPELDKYAKAQAESARLVYDEEAEAYELQGGESVSGSISPVALAAAIKRSVEQQEEQLDVSEAGLYGDEIVLAGSEKAQTALTEANAKLNLTLTYVYRVANAGIYGVETIDRELLSQWLTLDEDDLKLQVDTEALESYCQEMYDKYSDQTGKSAQFVTTGGQLIDVDVPAADQFVDVDALYHDILTCIATIQGGTRKAPYGTTPSGISGTTDLGGTYVEVDLDNQHLYLYKDGELIADDDICSGDVATNCETPTGLYTIKSKETERNLRGTGYVEWVQYWMPFYRGYGLHDASWRSEPEDFGGDVYLENGSHGCVNMPMDLAETVYNTVEVGTYVILYGGVQE